MNKEHAFQKIISWGNSHFNIDVILLTGSLATQNKTDTLSDIDVAVFGTSFNFINDDNWLSAIGKTWVCIHDQFYFEGIDIPTRLTIFEDGLKIDFSFHPIELLISLSNNKVLPDTYRNGYKVLLDKTGITDHLHHPDHKAFYIRKPGIEAFEKNQNEFWFECYHVAKYLTRNDLWTAKVRDGDAKALILQMLEWRQGAKHNWILTAKTNGREMQNWLEQPLWNTLFNCYAGFDDESSWKALEETLHYYRLVAKEAASLLEFAYNNTLDNNMSAFISQLQKF